MRFDRRLERFAGWGLIAGGVLYWLFYGATLAGFSLGDDFWMLGLSVHALSILAIMVGLIGGHAAFSLEGWASILWWVSTGLAFLGLSIANVFFALAACGLAVVAVVSLRRRWVAALLALGGGAWLYLYSVGVRVGDENARQATEIEELIGTVAAAIMALGLMGLGWAVSHRTTGRLSQTPDPVAGA